MMRLKIWEYNEKNRRSRFRWIRPIECVHCGHNILNTRYQLHLLIHSFEKPCQCQSCHLRFSHDDLLEAHMNLFHKNTTSGFEESLQLHRPERGLSTSMSDLQGANLSKDSQVTSVNEYQKVYKNTVEKRASRWEARNAGKSSTIQPSTLRSNTKGNSCPDLGTRRVENLCQISSGMTRCLLCDKEFFKFEVYVWHWKMIHFRANNNRKSFKQVTEHSHSQSNKPEHVHRNKHHTTASLLQRSWREILTARLPNKCIWTLSRKLSAKYKKVQIGLSQRMDESRDTTNRGKTTSPLGPPNQVLNDMNSKRNTGEAGFECPYCRQAFDNVYDFKIHIAIHEERTVHKCFFCNSQFLSTQHVETHLQTMHKLTIA